jgi:hypothetical protein
MARPSNEEYLERVHKVVEQRGGTLLSTEYVNARSKLNIQCAEGHLFSSRPHDILKKSWCPDCKREKHSRLMQANLRTAQELRKFAWIEHDAASKLYRQLGCPRFENEDSRSLLGGGPAGDDEALFDGPA